MYVYTSVHVPVLSRDQKDGVFKCGPLLDNSVCCNQWQYNLVQNSSEHPRKNVFTTSPQLYFGLQFYFCNNRQQVTYIGHTIDGHT